MADYAGDEPMMNGGNMSKQDKLVDDIIVMNGLHFDLPTELSASVKRVNRINYADKNTYSQNDNELLIRINSSNDYVIAGNCYLAFDIAIAASATSAGTTASNVAYVTMGNLGGASLFQRLIIETKNGAQAEYIDELSEYAAYNLYAENAPEYIADMAEAALLLTDNNGYPFEPAGLSGAVSEVAPTASTIISPTTTNVASVSLATGVTGATGSYSFDIIQRRCVIPLWWLSGIFANKNTLIPSYLLSGLRIRLALRSNLANVFTVYSELAGKLTAATVSSYLLSNVYIMTDSVELSPLIYRKLTSIAAERGLDYTFRTWYYQITNLSSTTSLNVEINKAVTRALEVRHQFYPQYGSGYFNDYNMTALFNIVQYYSRLGSLNFPAQPLTIIGNTPGAGGDVDVINRSSEFYYQNMQDWKKTIDGCCGSDIRFSDFKKNYSSICQCLERANLEFCGLPVNNSRSLASLLTFNTSRSLFCRSYLGYVKVLKVFLKESVPKE